LTPEQHKKLLVHKREQKYTLEVRIHMLMEKLIEQLHPFVEVKNPGVNGNVKMAAWEVLMCHEVDDLKLKSFGIELLHAIGTVYVTKVSSYLKSQKFLGM
jgi:X-domain of DnaJ-containing